MTEIYVITTNCKTGKVEQSRVIDHDSKTDRVWLGRHCFWAFRNGRAVLTKPAPKKENENAV